MLYQSYLKKAFWIYDKVTVTKNILLEENSAYLLQGGTELKDVLFLLLHPEKENVEAPFSFLSYAMDAFSVASCASLNILPLYTFQQSTLIAICWSMLYIP